ncbi:GTPase, partial [Staphylococcus epidermidis]|uniref:GTPase n=1 Tax=Staphylococcus epidermidis TaxID=1282 RepID=UPI001642EAA4
EGLCRVIVGGGNVGKCWMVNKVIEDNKGIVSEVGGRRREVLEEYVNVRGVGLGVVDSGGIRDSEDMVEKIGVERCRK